MIGERVCADNSELCGECFYCRRGQTLLCENFEAHGVTSMWSFSPLFPPHNLSVRLTASFLVDGGFAEYCAYPAGKVFRIHNLSDVDATLLEPASCACHGMERIAPKLGSSVLMFGAGPTGLCLAQLLRHNGASNLVIAAPEGLKMNLAKELNAADEYVPLSRGSPGAQLEAIKAANPHGFDIVVEVKLDPSKLSNQPASQPASSP